MLDNHAAEVLWLDCGDRIVRPTALPKIFNVIRALGFVSESSVRTTKRWVHPLMLKYLGAEGLDVLWHVLSAARGAWDKGASMWPKYHPAMLHMCSVLNVFVFMSN